MNEFQSCYRHDKKVTTKEFQHSKHDKPTNIFPVSRLLYGGRSLPFPRRRYWSNLLTRKWIALLGRFIPRCIFTLNLLLIIQHALFHQLIFRHPQMLRDRGQTIIVSHCLVVFWKEFSTARDPFGHFGGWLWSSGISYMDHRFENYFFRFEGFATPVQVLVNHGRRSGLGETAPPTRFLPSFRSYFRSETGWRAGLPEAVEIDSSEVCYSESIGNPAYSRPNQWIRWQNSWQFLLKSRRCGSWHWLYRMRKLRVVECIPRSRILWLGSYAWFRVWVNIISDTSSEWQRDCWSLKMHQFLSNCRPSSVMRASLTLKGAQDLIG